MQAPHAARMPRNPVDYGFDGVGLCNGGDNAAATKLKPNVAPHRALKSTTMPVYVNTQMM